MKKPICTVLIVSVASLSFAQNDPGIIKSFKQKAEELLGMMTLAEKAALCSGADEWSTKSFKRAGIPALWFSDGPHGLRRAPSTDRPGYGDQLPATCFPTASALAATWNRDLIYELGRTIADECRVQDVDILLGPGVNIKRSPLCGRNFEYYSEDPVLAGEIGSAFISGLQDNGIGACLKHFAINNQESNRMIMSSEVDERTMHELYLTAFEIPVKKARPMAVMASYNRINGTYGTQNRYLLTEILREQWGYKGMVISDWVSVVDRVEGVKAGLNLEMPSSNGGK